MRSRGGREAKQVGGMRKRGIFVLSPCSFMGGVGIGGGSQGRRDVKSGESGVGPGSYSPDKRSQSPSYSMRGRTSVKSSVGIFLLILCLLLFFSVGLTENDLLHGMQPNRRKLLLPTSTTCLRNVVSLPPSRGDPRVKEFLTLRVRAFVFSLCVCVWKEKTVLAGASCSFANNGLCTCVRVCASLRACKRQQEILWCGVASPVSSDEA